MFLSPQNVFHTTGVMEGAHSQPMTEAVYSASLRARGTMPEKAMGFPPVDREQNWQSKNPPLGWLYPPNPSAEISVHAICARMHTFAVARVPRLDSQGLIVTSLCCMLALCHLAASDQAVEWC